MTAPAAPRRAILLAAGLTAAIVATLAAAPAAMSAPGDGKVTICHRTHATTNPYRMITVSLNAADGQGRNDHTSHDEAYDDGSTVHRVYNPSVTYPPNQKWWGDIIPPVRNSQGLNWTEPRAQEIYTGTGNGFGLCTRLSAKKFFDLEVAAGIDPVAVLDDLDDQKSTEDALLLQRLGVQSFSELDPSALPAAFTTQPDVPVGPRPPAGYAPEPSTQKFAVVIWFDRDADGEFDEDELPAPGIAATLTKVIDATLDETPDSRSLTTDERGEVIVTGLPAGQWLLSTTLPDGTTVTYDSEGASDGEAQSDLPAGSAAFAWVGLSTLSTSTPEGGDESDGGESGGETDGRESAEPELTALPETGGALDAATLAVGAGALVMLGVAFARRASSARRRPDDLLEAE